MKKNEKVPGMTDTKPNREQRRHPEKFAQPENEPLSRDDQAVQGEDVPTPHAKNKKTADKWNQ